MFIHFKHIFSRLLSEEIREALGESESEIELYHASDEDEYCPNPAAIVNEKIRCRNRACYDEEWRMKNSSWSLDRQFNVLVSKDST